LNFHSGRWRGNLQGRWPSIGDGQLHVFINKRTYLPAFGEYRACASHKEAHDGDQRDCADYASRASYPFIVK
jgi:hypothetical protein